MEGFGDGKKTNPKYYCRFLGFPLKTTPNGKCFVVQHGMRPIIEMYRFLSGVDTFLFRFFGPQMVFVPWWLECLVVAVQQLNLSILPQCVWPALRPQFPSLINGQR